MIKKNGLLMNLSLLTVAQVAAQLLNLVALVVLARHLEAALFGIVQVGVAVSAYALVTAEWGLNSLAIRDVSRFSGNPRKILAYGRVHQGLLAGMALIVFFGFVIIFYSGIFPIYEEAPRVFLFYAALVFPQIISLEWLGISLERMRQVGVAKVFTSMFYASFIIGIMGDGTSLDNGAHLHYVPLIYLLSFFLGSLFLIIPAREWVAGVAISPRWPSIADIRERMPAASPIGASILVMRVLMNGDMIMLGLLSQAEVAGRYAASAKIGFLMVIAMEVLWKALLPRLSRLAGQSHEAFSRRFQLFLGTVVAVLGPAVVIALVAGPDLMALVYGDDFGLDGSIFQILALSYTLFALAWFLGNSLIATDRQREFFLPLLISAVVAVIANWILIEKMEGLGAALGMLISHSVLLIIMVLVCRDWFERNLMRAFRYVLQGLIAMGLVVFALSSLSVVLQLIGGTLVYGIVAGYPMKKWINEIRG